MPSRNHAVISLSAAQQQIWLLHEMDSSKTAYTSLQHIEFDQKVDPSIIQHSLNLLVRRHEMLRTVFRDIEGTMVQAVAEPFEVLLPIIDLHSVEDDSNEISNQIASALRARPFHLAELPLFRVCLVELPRN